MLTINAQARMRSFSVIRQEWMKKTNETPSAGFH